MSDGIDPALLATMCCPLTRTPLRYDAVRGELVSDAAGVAFAVVDGVPVMLADRGRAIASG